MTILLRTHQLVSRGIAPMVLRSQRSFMSSQVPKFHEKDPLHEGNKYSRVPERGFIELEGQDTTKFLQGLITNHMPRLSTGGDGFFAGFLTPQGRVLYDVFIYPVNHGDNFPHPKFMVECSSSLTSSLLKHLKRYVLRSKVKMRDVSEEYSVYNIWGQAINSATTKAITDVPTGMLVKTDKRLTDIGCMDPRVPGFGYRAVLKQEEDIKRVLPAADYEELLSSEYTIRRILHGIAEGPLDLWPEQALPLEANFDFMNGVDFRKGCYVGQELTIRTYHTGVVRKRVVPVQYYQEGDNVPKEMKVDRQIEHSSALIPQLDIKPVDVSSKRGVGKTCSAVHNIGLALMRLEQVEKCNQDGSIAFAVPEAGNVRVRPFLPEWWTQEQA
ncbi:uncharacterized protein BYT42DRAFT_563252 [Radiomyces spectabilis]|uniref:uncharacterized protein n=1 Tax=Radiomyces spectabilis TaxID=64574 RepID=UPI00221E7704|nr:uncharacterized protein BYT42DRAFT_563252 [Radiomyces spectabilis]KAI8384666.1 hypothetical protein BYT42DRAFT_563252 [Radiomyces spectabilis]